MYLKRTRKKNNNYHISPSPQTPGWAAPIRHLYWGNTTCRGSQCGTGMGIIVQCYLCRAKERSLWWRSLKAYPPGSQNFIHVIATHQKFWWASIWVLNPSLKQWGLRAMLSPLAVFSYLLRHGVNSVLTHKKYLYTLCSSLRGQLNTAKGAQPQVKHLFPCVSAIRDGSLHPDPYLPKLMTYHYDTSSVLAICFQHLQRKLHRPDNFFNKINFNMQIKVVKSLLPSPAADWFCKQKFAKKGDNYMRISGI